MTVNADQLVLIPHRAGNPVETFKEGLVVMLEDREFLTPAARIEEQLAQLSVADLDQLLQHWMYRCAEVADVLEEQQAPLLAAQYCMVHGCCSIVLREVDRRAAIAASTIDAEHLADTDRLRGSRSSTR